MSDSAGRKVTSHQFVRPSVIAQAYTDRCAEPGCGQPESAHRSAPPDDFDPKDPQRHSFRLKVGWPETVDHCHLCGQPRAAHRSADPGWLVAPFKNLQDEMKRVDAESAHRSAPQPSKDRPDWEAIKALGKSVDWPTNMPIVGAAAPDNAEDRLRAVADHIRDLAILRPAHLSDKIHAALEAVVREEREAACRAVCGPCADGWEVKRGVEAGKADLWYHPTQRDRGAQICQAGAIRARGQEEKP